MSAITKWVPAGFVAFQWSYRHLSGYIAGVANLTSSNTATSSSMGRHRGALTAPFELPAATVTPVPGDDGVRATFLFDPTANPSFTLELSDFDGAFHQAVTGITSVTDGDTETYAIPFAGQTFNTFILMFSGRLKSQTSGQVGAPGFEHLTLLNCDISFAGRGFASQGVAPYKYTISCNQSSTMPDGRTVASVFTTANNGEIGGFYRSSDYLYSYSALVGNGVLQKIVTANNPYSTSKAKAAVETTGFAADTVTSVTTSAPYGINITATPASGKFAIGRYEFLTFA